MENASFGRRLRYRFDNAMARGPIALIVVLAGLSLGVVLIAAIVVSIFGIKPGDFGPGENLGFIEAFWRSLMRTLDPGTMGGDVGWGFRIAMLLVTLGGVFVVATFIGVLATAIDSRLTELRKGRSVVMETDHTLILGWSSKIFTILSELAVANESKKRPRVVVLAEKDKVEMEDEIRAKVTDLGPMRVICRTGTPLSVTDLHIVNPHGAKAIIVLSPPDTDSDAHVIKSVLALVNNPDRRPEPYHIVAEIHHPRNLAVAKMIGGDEVQLVRSDDLIARITAQTCRQSGLSVVYTEFLDFAGDEIYFGDEPRLVGRTFGDAALAYEDSTAMGMRTADGTIIINPPRDQVLAEGDRLIFIAADDSAIALPAQPVGVADVDAVREASRAKPKPEHTLVLGWNDLGHDIVRELDAYVPPKSQVTIVADVRELDAQLTALEPELSNQKLTFKRGDTVDRATLESLPLAACRHVIILAMTEELDAEAADSATLITLLHLRDLASLNGYDFSIVTQMLDPRNRELAQATQADDFIVSDQLTSLALSQVSENPELNAVFTELFDPEGSEVYLKPASDYVELGRPVNFYTVLESALRQGEVAIGYRLHALATDPNRSYGVEINPKKSTAVTFGERDKVVVVAED